MLTLVIGNKNYSSWSLRPWLALKQAGIAFHEVAVDLYGPDSKAQILKHSPSGKVPALIDAGLTVWDSMAICEYAAEVEPTLWPLQRAARAVARAVSAEMHAGFAALRSKMPMNCKAALPGEGRTPEVERDIARIAALWEECRERFGGGGAFLFGAFSIADAMYAPVVWRFRTYAVALPPAARAYAEAMEALPAMQEWLAAALAEPERKS
jgi:glutathione S-transferase